MPDLTEVLMPQLGETVTEGTILQWFKAPGDEVAEDDELFEVSTDKVDTTVPSAVSGVLREIFVEAGDTVPVGARLAAIDTGGEGAASDAAPPASQPAVTPTARPTAPPARDDARAAPVASAAPAASTRPTTSAVALAERPAGDGSPGAFLSPAVRRLLDEHDLDPIGIAGTGAGGRITRDDVRRAIDLRSDRTSTDVDSAPQPDAADAAQATAATDEPARAVAVADGDEVIAFTPLRRRIAEHMTRSLRTSAHTLVVMEVDYADVAAVRDARKAAFKEQHGVGLTYLPFIARALVQAIAEYPLVNASVDGDQLVVHRAVNLGVAVDLDFAGLIVPVVKHADEHDLRELAVEMAGQAARAREKTLAADDVAGGTFTITNAGAYGTLLTGPIINQPQVAILSTDGVKMKPVAVALDDGTYGVAVHPMGNLALSFDHRAFDGAYASAFLARVVRELETRDWAAEVDGAAPDEGGAA